MPGAVCIAVASKSYGSTVKYFPNLIIGDVIYSTFPLGSHDRHLSYRPVALVFLIASNKVIIIVYTCFTFHT